MSETRPAVTVHIRRNADGVIRTMHEDAWNEYWWSEGNASCDCNRHLFFERADGNDPGLDDMPCSETKYSVKATLEDGRIWYKDAFWDV